jgi:hypothetical protein
MIRMGEPPELSESPVLPSGSDSEEVGFVEADAEVDGLATTSDGLATAAGRPDALHAL